MTANSKVPALGEPIPNNLHGVSVSLPKWADVVGYEECDPRVINAMQLGYPRFVYHPLIKKLFAEAESQFASHDEFCMVFPSEKTATDCAEYCLGKGSLEYQPWEINNLSDDIFTLTLPKGLEKRAKEYWQHAGFIISSRQAEAYFAGTTPKTNCKPDVQKRLGEIAGAKADDIYLYPSGMAAIFSAYEITAEHSTVQLGFPYVDTLKIQQKFADETNSPYFLNYKSEKSLDELEALIAHSKISAVFCEFPCNPLLSCIELERLSKICRKNHIALVIDDTLSTWANADLIPYSDITVTSLTKFFSGVGNVLAGSLILNSTSPLYSKLKTKLDASFEDLLFEADAEVLLENSKNFEERIAKINHNAEKFFAEISVHPKVKTVYYTKGNPVYDKYKKAGGGYGGVISVVFKTEADAVEYYDNLQVKKGPSLGTNYTLACPYTLLAHYYERQFAEDCDVPFHLIRFSIGAD